MDPRMVQASGPTLVDLATSGLGELRHALATQAAECARLRAERDRWRQAFRDVLTSRSDPLLALVDNGIVEVPGHERPSPELARQAAQASGPTLVELATRGLGDLRHSLAAETAESARLRSERDRWRQEVVQGCQDLQQGREEVQQLKECLLAERRQRLQETGRLTAALQNARGQLAGRDADLWAAGKLLGLAEMNNGLLAGRLARSAEGSEVEPGTPSTPPSAPFPSPCASLSATAWGA